MKGSDEYRKVKIPLLNYYLESFVSSVRLVNIYTIRMNQSLTTVICLSFMRAILDYSSKHVRDPTVC